MAGKKTRKKVAPAIEMKSNPLTRRKKISRSRSPSRPNTKKTLQKVKMVYNPVRDCGSIGGTKKKKKKQKKKQKKKSCDCNKLWFF